VQFETEVSSGKMAISFFDKLKKSAAIQVAHKARI
jgi:hypothetical protein